MQEIIWAVQPDLIIETGIAHGGSLVYYASILELVGRVRVLGVDIEIRPENREALERHKMRPRIELIEGSSIDPIIIEKVRALAREAHKIIVVLDSNHSHLHVLEEMRLYADLVSPGSYLVVFDTIIERLPKENRPWGPGDSPLTAVEQFLKERRDFVVDASVEKRIGITVAPSGYRRRVDQGESRS